MKNITTGLSPQAAQLLLVLVVAAVGSLLLSSKKVLIAVIGGILTMGAVAALLATYIKVVPGTVVSLILSLVFLGVGLRIFSERKSWRGGHAIVGGLIIAAAVSILFVQVQGFNLVPTGTFGEIWSRGWEVSTDLLNKGVAAIGRILG